MSWSHATPHLPIITECLSFISSTNRTSELCVCVTIFMVISSIYCRNISSFELKRAAILVTNPRKIKFHQDMWLFRSKGPSGFSSSSTAEEVTAGIDGSALTAIVTGPLLPHSVVLLFYVNPPHYIILNSMNNLILSIKFELLCGYNISLSIPHTNLILPFLFSLPTFRLWVSVIFYNC